MKLTSVWPFIYLQLQAKEPVVLLLVLESTGSSPGRQGFKMAVTKNEMEGCIGGGIMEHKFVELAREKLQETVINTQIKKQFHTKSAGINQSGMICSGEQTIFLYRLKEEDIESVKMLIDSLKQFENGKLTFSPQGIHFSKITPNQNFLFDHKKEDEWKYIEKTGAKNVLHIIGGGHCSLALSKVMIEMDFCVNVYEDRKNLNTFIANDYAHRKVVVNDYAELTTIISGGMNQYVVIMTFGYRTDDVALRAVINSDYKYIGVLGSKSKMVQLFNEWKSKGLSNDRLNKINSPIGISIKSQTAEEIAISIAAEIIQVKNAE